MCIDDTPRKHYRDCPPMTEAEALELADRLHDQETEEKLWAPRPHGVPCPPIKLDKDGFEIVDDCGNPEFLDDTEEDNR